MRYRLAGLLLVVMLGMPAAASAARVFHLFCNEDSPSRSYVERVDGWQMRMGLTQKKALELRAQLLDDPEKENLIMMDGVPLVQGTAATLLDPMGMPRLHVLRPTLEEVKAVEKDVCAQSPLTTLGGIHGVKEPVPFSERVRDGVFQLQCRELAFGSVVMVYAAEGLQKQIAGETVYHFVVRGALQLAPDLGRYLDSLPLQEVRIGEAVRYKRVPKIAVNGTVLQSDFPQLNHYGAEGVSFAMRSLEAAKTFAADACEEVQPMAAFVHNASGMNVLPLAVLGQNASSALPALRQ